MLIITGKVWKLGDNIDTDIITPAKFLSLPMSQLKQHVMEPIDPQFSKRIKPGIFLSMTSVSLTMLSLHLI